MRIERWNSIPEQFKCENTDVCEDECVKDVCCNHNHIDVCHNNNECNIILPILILLIMNRYNCM